MAFDIDQALRYVVEHEGSDLHVKVPAKPMARVHGVLEPIPDTETLTPEDTDAALEHILHDPNLLAEFGDVGEADFSYEVPGVSRFRVNAFRQRGHVSIVCRAIPFQVRTIDDLGLPQVIKDLADEKRGIILLTGTTGSGKSTTLAAMIDQINSKQPQHIVTLEDPIEYLHRDKRSIINQREVGQDTESFARAMKRVLRQDPDVILIGEMRDEETVRTVAVSRRDRPPRALDAPHPGRDRDDQPHHRLLPAAPAAAGARDAGLDPSRRRRPAPDAEDRRRPRRRLRGARGHRPRPGPDPEPERDGQDHRGDRRGRVLRHADLRPGAPQARDGRDHHRGGRDDGRLEPARLQAHAPGRRPARLGHRAGHGERRLEAAPEPEPDEPVATPQRPVGELLGQ